MDSVTQLGDWKKISVLGSGAFGIVVLFKNQFTSDFVAIKLCKFTLSSSLSEKQKQRWQNEVVIMKSLNHENIIKFKEIPHDLEASISKYNATKLPLLSMEYCSKGNLRHVLHDTRNVSGLSETDVRYLLSDIRNGLEYLHAKNITHRDLKPDNIVLQHCADRQTETVYKIIDLGYAKELNGNQVSFVGTLDYLAPEIFHTKHYTNSVDYWSFGVLTFEVICGVLPFLGATNATPFERFEVIRKKKPEHVYIYKSNSGQIIYSSNLKPEHHISNCLADHLQYWLRHVLHYNPTVRAQHLPNTTTITVLQSLKHILAKRILHVFYMYKLEFYSYEYNDYTLLSTVTDWIARDIQVDRNDFIVLISEEMFGVMDGNVTLNELFSNQTPVPVLYVMRKGGFVHLHFNNIPNLVKTVASGRTLDSNCTKQFYMQIVYYVTNEKRLWYSFCAGFRLYGKYVRFLCDSVEDKFHVITKHLTTIQSNIVCCNKFRQKWCGKCTDEYVECLKCFQRLAASLERTIECAGKLYRKVVNIKNRQVVLNGAMGTIEKCLHKWNAVHMYENVMKLLQKCGTKGTPNEMTTKELIQIVSHVVKGKSNLFHDKLLMDCVNVMETVISSSTVLLTWMHNFAIHIDALSHAFDRNEINYRNLLITCAIIQNSAINTNMDWCNRTSDELIQLNRNTRSAFSNKIEEFHTSLRNTLEDINS